MWRIARLFSILMFSGFVLIGAGYSAGQQSTALQSNSPLAGYHGVPAPTKAAPGAKPRTAQSVASSNDKLADQLAQVQGQLTQLQDTIEAMRKDQQYMRERIDAWVEIASRNEAQETQIARTLDEHGATIDLIARQVDVAQKQVDLIGTRGIVLLLDRTNTLPSDLRQIKTKLGLY